MLRNSSFRDFKYICEIQSYSTMRLNSQRHLNLDILGHIGVWNEFFYPELI